MSFCWFCHAAAHIISIGMFEGLDWGGGCIGMFEGLDRRIYWYV